MARGITLTDLSEEKTERIRENLDFDLPQNAKMYSVYANSQQDSTFRMIFEIPREDREVFLASVAQKYERELLDSRDGYADSSITVKGKKYFVARANAHMERGFTAVLEYGESADGGYLYQLVYHRPPEEIGAIFQ